MAAQKLIIDCDPGTDDAIALLMALAPFAQVQVLGITTVAGNVSLDLTTVNARRICELAGQTQVGVYAGCPRPLLRPLITAETVHGKTGLDGVALPDPQMPLQSLHAVPFLIDTLMQSAGDLMIAALAPLTNLAVALIQQPAIAQKISQLVIMGGAITQGNITPSAEFNFYVDPHAAQVVLQAGIPVTLVTLDITHQAIATPERLAPIRQQNTAVSQVVIDLLTHYSRHDIAIYGFAGAPLHDPCVIAYLMEPGLFTTRPVAVTVETTSELTLGRSVVDLWQVTGAVPNLNLVETIDVEGFYHLLTQAIASYGG